jgi:heme exporter protein CcmD
VIGKAGGAMLVAMDDAGFIIGSYVITLAVVGGLALAIVRRGRRLADRVDDADKYWI